MKKLLFFFVLAFVSPIGIMAQSVILSFFGNDANGHWVRHDSVTITNETKGWQETIYWPDNRLVMQNNVGIDDVETCQGTSLQLSQNNPNPFNGTTDVVVTVADAGAVTLEIADVNGRVVEVQNFASLQVGFNQFRITLSAVGTYVLTARQNGKMASIKMVNNGAGNGNGIEYAGIVETPYYDVSTKAIPKSHIRAYTNNPFEYGDVMEYVGYATINGEPSVFQSVSQVPESDDVIMLRFDVALVMPEVLPCPGTPTLTDIDGNVYNTVQIGSQCWMKENLRTTRYADSTGIPTGTSDSYTLPYRYFPNNDESTVPDYGFLYNWSAVMHGGTSSDAEPSGVQGICPTGWHVPSRSEWTALTDYVSSMDVYVCGSNTAWIAKSLASATGWNNGALVQCVISDDVSSNNATGFSGLPAGTVSASPGVVSFGVYGRFWSSTQTDDDNAGVFSLFSQGNYVELFGVPKNQAYSVRCVRD